MRYRDRHGNEYKETTKQDRLLNDAYESYLGRSVLEIASLPVFSKLSRKVLNSRLSSGFIEQFADSNHIDMFDYEEKQYSSFNEFFTRRIKPGRTYPCFALGRQGQRLRADSLEYIRHQGLRIQCGKPPARQKARKEIRGRICADNKAERR